MCTIDKMLIKGIRAFSPDNTAVIEFYKPLTLIVGHNGSGKTTIIECLKMACTGELPPNTRSGQSFVHDPKIAGEAEVKAQIKLRFATAARQPVVVLRCFQLTQKKASLQFKALDNTVQTVNARTGEHEALSYRCADIDRVVPALMGVSKAVLENVVFVHQEDSNWPLAEGQVLKKRFDDIFAATRYTKALEELRKLRVKQAAEVKEMRLKLEHLKTHKEHAAALQARIDDGRAREATVRAAGDELRRRVAAADAELAGLDAQLTRIADLADEATAARGQHGMLAARNAETAARLLSAYGAEDMEQPLEELEEMLAGLAPDVAAAAADVARLQREIAGGQLEAEALKEQYSRDARAHGRAAAEAEAHARNVADRDRFVRRLVAELGLDAVALPPGDAPLGAPALAAFHDALEARVGAARAALAAAKAHAAEVDSGYAATVDALSAQISGAGEGVRMQEAAARDALGRVAGLQAQLQGLPSGRDLLELAAEHAARTEAEAAARAAALEGAGGAGARLEADARARQAELEEGARKASGLREERERLARSADAGARARYLAREVVELRAQLDTLVASKAARLEALLGGGPLPAPEGLRAAVEAAAERARAGAAAADAAAAAAAAKVAAARGAADAAAAQARRAEGELAALAARLRAATEGESATVQALLATAEGSRSAQVTKLEQVKALQTVTGRYVETARVQSACAVCRRPFGSAAERDAFLAEQAEQAGRMPSMLAALSAELAALDARAAALRELAPAAARHDALRDAEVPEARARAAAAGSEAAALAAAADAAAAAAAAAAAEAASAQELLQEVARPADRLAAEVAAKQAELARLRAAAGGGADAGASRTVADVDADLEDLEARRAEAERARDEARRRLGAMRDALAAARAEAAAAREEVLRLQAGAERRAALEAQIEAARGQAAALEADAAERRGRRAPLEAERAAAVAARDAARAQAAAKEADLDAALRELQALEQQLRGRERAVSEYEAAGGAAALARAAETLDALRARQDAREAEVRHAQATLLAASGRAAEHEALQRQLADVIAWRRDKAREAELGARLDALGAAAAAVGDADALRARHRAAAAARDAARAEAYKLQGQLAEVAGGIDAATRELAGAPALRDVGGRFRRQLIELRTTEMALSDLEKYHRALERALLSFHTSKMADINAIVKELWQKTYRAPDIDYIAVRADADAGGAASRSYNYRVVMVCGGTELDMRGRCSAGQRVLASLVLRLALAETFCLNCGILALDEPTTNLDAENAASLAEALRAIMAARRGQENFQLVVITHDEDFARAIGTREHAESLWRVSKDDRQHSTITREDIADHGVY